MHPDGKYVHSCKQTYKHRGSPCFQNVYYISTMFKRLTRLHITFETLLLIIFSLFKNNPRIKTYKNIAIDLK